MTLYYDTIVMRIEAEDIYMLKKNSQIERKSVRRVRGGIVWLLYCKKFLIAYGVMY